MNRSSCRFIPALAVCAVCAVSSASPASADVLPIPAVSVEINGFESGTDPANGQKLTRETTDIDPAGNFEIRDSNRPGAGIWSLQSLDVSGNIDPIANLDFAVTNTSNMDVDFVFTVVVPIIPPLPATVIGGAASYTVTDVDDDDFAEIKSNPAADPFFTGLLDGVDSLPLFVAPFSTVTDGTLTEVEFAGLPGPTILSGPALTTIGIEINFTLSPGDSASGTTTFVVEIIPEPSTLLILAAIAPLAISRRR